ncbi:hypothetical protein [Altererythrobacter sp. MTPC7]|uniref:hypothetical protein n=1 Tax=Altererythrobacter sp. MTPC7 TaxID=3056567 RepID=UPI0036F3CC63
MIDALPGGIQINLRLPAGERPIRTSLERHIENAPGSAQPTEPNYPGKLLKPEG